MINAVLASAALMATTALAQGVGSAYVVNKCSYPVHLQNTPASGGGYNAISQVIQTGGQYTQEWTELSNSQGWSLKLSQSDSMANIMQYEYTFHNDGIIWYDLSDVNGNPWNGNWEITAAGADCNPKQQAYQYATDDAYGMQACPQAATITVTLCSGTSSGGTSGESSAPESAAPTSTSIAPETSVAPETSTSVAPATSAPAETSTFATPSSAAPTWWGHQTWGLDGNKVAEAAGSSPTSFLTSTTTLASSTTDADLGGVTVTEVATQVVTQLVTATAVAKRHEHHRHPHHRL